MFILVVSSKITVVDGCSDLRQRDNGMELAMLRIGVASVCTVIIDGGFVDALRYEMSVDILRNLTSPGTSGLVFNVQEGGRSWNNTDYSSSNPPINYDFVLMRY